MKQIVAIIFLIVCIFAPFVAAAQFSWWYLFPSSVVAILAIIWGGNAGLYDR